MAFKTQPPDEIDIRIIEYIRDNPACGIGDVTRETREYGLQNATIRYRVNKLSKKGYIRLDKVLDRYYLLYHTEKAAHFLMLTKDQPKRSFNEEGGPSPRRFHKGNSPSSCQPNQEETEAIR